MIDDLYTTQVIGLSGNITRIGRLPKPQASATARSKLCGSTVTIDLMVENDVVTDFAHVLDRACAIAQASSAVMAANIVGTRTSELRALRDVMIKMLKENGQPPEGRFSDLRYLDVVRDFKYRHPAALLTFDAVVDALDQIDRAQAEKAA